MKDALVALSLTLLWAGGARAQSADPSKPASVETQSVEITSTLVEQGQQGNQQTLLDTPIPILPSKQDGPVPCPAGVGRPCALLGGRLYFSDPSRMAQHDKSWAGALKHPMILGGLAANMASSIWDYRATRHCIAAHTCKEGNPLMGQTRAQQLSVGIGLNVTLYFLAAKLKQYGKGNQAFGILLGGASLHSYAALRAQTMDR